MKTSIADETSKLANRSIASIIKRDLNNSHKESFNSSNISDRRKFEDSRREDNHINFKGIDYIIKDQQVENSFIILSSESMEVANNWTCVINYFISR